MTARRVAAVLGLLLASTAFATRAQAQACCGSSGGSDFALVPWCHGYAVAAQLTYEHGLGAFDEKGRPHAFRKGFSVEDFALQLGAGWNLAPRLQVNASVPLRLQARSFPGVDETRVRQGDVETALRWLVVGELSGPGWQGPEGFELAMATHFRIPTGIAPEDSANPFDPVQGDVTSDGDYELGVSVMARDKITESNLAGVRLAYAHRFTREVERFQMDPIEVDRGELFAVRGIWSTAIGDAWHLGGFVDGRWTTQEAINVELQAGSEVHRLRAGAYIVRSRVFEEWETTLSVAGDPPWFGATCNIPYANVAVSLGIQRNAF